MTADDDSIASPQCISGRTTTENVSNARSRCRQQAANTTDAVPLEISTSQDAKKLPSPKRKHATAAHTDTPSYASSDELIIPDLSDVRDPNNPHNSFEPFMKKPKQSPLSCCPRVSSSRLTMPSDTFRRVLFAKELVQPNHSSLSTIDPSLFCESISNVLLPIIQEFDDEKMAQDYQHSLGGSKANVKARLKKNNHLSLDGVPRQSAVVPGFSNLSGPSRAHALSATHSTFDSADLHESTQLNNDNQVSDLPGVTEATASNPVHSLVEASIADNRRSFSSLKPRLTKNNHVSSDGVPDLRGPRRVHPLLLTNSTFDAADYHESTQPNTHNNKVFDLPRDLSFVLLSPDASRASEVMTDDREYINPFNLNF